MKVCGHGKMATRPKLVCLSGQCLPNLWKGMQEELKMAVTSAQHIHSRCLDTVLPDVLAFTCCQNVFAVQIGRPYIY